MFEAHTQITQLKHEKTNTKINPNLYVAAIYSKRRFKVIQEVKVYSTDIVRPAYQG